MVVHQATRPLVGSLVPIAAHETSFVRFECLKDYVTWRPDAVERLMEVGCLLAPECNLRIEQIGTCPQDVVLDTLGLSKIESALMPKVFQRPLSSIHLAHIEIVLLFV